MRTSFSSFYPYTEYLDSDHPSFYTVHQFSDHLVWELQLVHTRSNIVIDRLSLMGLVTEIHPIWNDHLVLNYIFDIKDWNTELATEEQIAEVKAHYDARNTTRLEDFIAEHNSNIQNSSIYEHLVNNLSY